jgi:hypothetical protein
MKGKHYYQTPLLKWVWIASQKYQIEFSFKSNQILAELSSAENLDVFYDIPIEFFTKVFSSFSFEQLLTIIQTPELAAKIANNHTELLFKYIVENHNMNLISKFFEIVKPKYSFDLTLITPKISSAINSDNPNENLEALLTLRSLLSLIHWIPTDTIYFTPIWDVLKYSIQNNENEFQNLQVEILFIASQKNFIEKDFLFQSIQLELNSKNLDILVEIGFFFLENNFHTDILIPFLIPHPLKFKT